MSTAKTFQYIGASTGFDQLPLSSGGYVRQEDAPRNTKNSLSQLKFDDLIVSPKKQMRRTALEKSDLR